jgi:hypothetical protein
VYLEPERLKTGRSIRVAASLGPPYASVYVYASIEPLY